jgi:hypothetical protein
VPELKFTTFLQTIKIWNPTDQSVKSKPTLRKLCKSSAFLRSTIEEAFGGVSKRLFCEWTYMLELFNRSMISWTLEALSLPFVFPFVVDLRKSGFLGI